MSKHFWNWGCTLISLAFRIFFQAHGRFKQKYPTKFQLLQVEKRGKKQAFFFKASFCIAFTNGKNASINVSCGLFSWMKQKKRVNNLLP